MAMSYEETIDHYIRHFNNKSKRELVEQLAVQCTREECYYCERNIKKALEKFKNKKS